ncbi:MAG: hypothetical protein ACTIII_15310 [Brachybacterium alimentarium]
MSTAADDAARSAVEDELTLVLLDPEQAEAATSSLPRVDLIEIPDFLR